MTPSEKSARLDALLRGKGAYLAMKEHGVDRVPADLMRATFPFTREDLLEYLATSGTPIEDFARSHGIFVEEHGGDVYVVEYEERFGPSRTKFPSLQAAHDWLREYLLRHTYTGLDFK
jgi:hypothetical protein